MNNRKLMEIEKRYEENHWTSDMVYDFVQEYSRMMAMPHDYGTGDLVYTIDAHSIRYIRYKPGTTVTDLAKYWEKTKATVSAQITRLVQQGYLEKEPDPKNDKIMHIHLTKKGLEFDKAHEKYDKKHGSDITDILLKNHSQKEIESFFEIMAEYTQISKQQRISE